MLYVIDRPKGNWGRLSDDLTEVFFEDGKRVPLTPSRVKLTFWKKYEGMKLSEVSDIRDLNWLLKVAGEKDEQFAAMMFTMRLKELEQ